MRVGVIMGGFSQEREISFHTGRDIINNIDRNKYDVKEIILDSKKDVFEKIKDIDFAFIALHGEFGEDGKIQSILEVMGIPYSGSGVLSSNLCMDKNLTKIVLKEHGIPTAKWLCIKDLNDLDYDNIDSIGYPLVIKPNAGGSSICTYLAKNRSELVENVSKVLEVDKCAIVEEYIRGEEYSVFLQDRNVFPIIHIKGESGIVDYNSKYLKNNNKELAVIPKNIDIEIKDMSKKCWDALQCEVYVRVDIIYKNNKAYVLELNTLPSIREKGMVVKSVNEVGITLTQLIDRIIESSLKKL